jgi:hypothetical protein
VLEIETAGPPFASDNSHLLELRGDQDLDATNEGDTILWLK